MTAPSALHQRCFHHPLREAASRCPSCRRYFCRECVTEHEDRVICADCLKKLARSRPAHAVSVRGLLRGLLPVAGLLIAWLCFYAVGRTLLLIPVSVHDGSIWESK
jgi:hypothetical protein